MLVEIWSDVVCPWCYIGKRRFESALARFAHRGEVGVLWRSFELDRDAPARRGPTAEHLARKYGWSADQVAASHARLESLAAAEGLEYHLDQTQGGNTFDAHRLIHAAREAGKQDELEERLMLERCRERRSSRRFLRARRQPSARRRAPDAPRPRRAPHWEAWTHIQSESTASSSSRSRGGCGS